MLNSPIKKLAGDTAVYGLGTVVPRLLNYLLVPFYTIMVFNKAQYGQITELYAYVAIVMVLLTYGMETSFFRFANNAKEPLKIYNSATSSLFITSFSFIVLILIFNRNIADIISYSGHREYIIFIGLIVAIDAFTSLPFAYLRFRNKARRFSLIKIANVLINITFNFIFLIIIPKLFPNSYHNFWIYRQTGLVGFVFISNLIASIFTLLLLIPELKIFSFEIDKETLKKMLAYGLPILIIGFAGMINEVSDKILLRYLLPKTVNVSAVIGVYGANYKLAILMMLFIQMFRYAAEPFFFAEAEKKDAKKTYSRVMTIFVIFTWFIFLLVMLFIDGFKYFIGRSFWVGLSIVPIVLIAKLFLGIFYNLSVWYKLTDKTLYGGMIAVAGALITIILNIILIPKYGYVGSAWANFACYFSMVIFSFVLGRKFYKINYEIGKLIFYSLFALALFALSKILYLNITIYRFIVGFVLITIYVTIVFIIEKKHVKQSKTTIYP